MRRLLADTRKICKNKYVWGLLLQISHLDLGTDHLP